MANTGRCVQQRIPQTEAYWQSGGKRWHPPVTEPATGLAEVLRKKLPRSPDSGSSVSGSAFCIRTVRSGRHGRVRYDAAALRSNDVDQDRLKSQASAVPMPTLITCYPFDAA